MILQMISGAKRAISSARKERPAAVKKAEIAKAAKEAGVLKDNGKRDHRKAMNPSAAVDSFGSQGVTYNEELGLRCKCTGVCMDGWCRSCIKRHLATKAHVNWEAHREEEGVEQAFLEELYEAKKSEESDRLRYVGFSKKTVKTCLASGIPLARVDTKTPLCQYLQETSGLKLSNRSDLGAYIPELMEEEEKILANELEGVNLSAIYDATPCQGDFFAMLARFVHTDEKLRRATARH